MGTSMYPKACALRSACSIRADTAMQWQDLGPHTLVVLARLSIWWGLAAWCEHACVLRSRSQCTGWRE